MHIVIVGIGRTGRRIVELATRDQHEVVVIDHDAERAAAASQDFDCIVMHADATSSNILEEAGTTGTDALITTTPDDAVNLMVMMLGRKLGARQLLSSVSNPAHIRLFQEMGVHIVESPHRLNGQYFYRAVQRPSIRDFDATRPEAFNLMGVLMQLRGELHEARRYYESALAARPSFESARRNQTNLAKSPAERKLGEYHIE